MSSFAARISASLGPSLELNLPVHQFAGATHIANSKFIKCPPPKSAATTTKKCCGANGKFVKCGTLGAKPA